VRRSSIVALGGSPIISNFMMAAAQRIG